LILLNIVNKNIINTLDKLKPNKALKVYNNFYTDRKELYKEFKGDKKGYIYIIINKLNGKCYVGSTRSIKVRLYNYFNLALLEAQKGRPISSAILKYGLVNFAFVIIEEVDLEIHNLEDRETYWIKKIKPEYNAIKEAARNLSVPHLSETKLKISISRSSGIIYVYDELKRLLVIVPSLSSLAISLGSSSISISIFFWPEPGLSQAWARPEPGLSQAWARKKKYRSMQNETLFRSCWYISKYPFGEKDEPIMGISSPEYSKLIEEMKSKKHIRKAIFVFKDGEFYRKYDGLLEAEKDLNVSHDTINANIENNTTYKGYRFSLHRIK